MPTAALDRAATRFALERVAATPRRRARATTTTIRRRRTRGATTTRASCADDAQRWIDAWTKKKGATTTTATTTGTIGALDATLPAEAAPAAAPPAPASAPRERKPGEISPEMRKKLLGESVGLGGLPEKPMPSNIFLNVILGVTLIVVVAYAGGIRP